LRQHRGVLVAGERDEAVALELVLQAQREQRLVGLVDRREVHVHLAHVARVLALIIAQRRRRGERGEAARQKPGQLRQRVHGFEGEPVGQATQHAAGIVVAHLLLAACARTVFLEIRGHQVDGGLVGRRPAQRAAHRVLVAVVHVVAGVDVLGIAVALQGDAGDACGEPFAERRVQRALDLRVVVVAVLPLDVAAEHAGFRGFRDHVDRAARGVAPVQRALRAAQYRDLLDVVVLGLEQAREQDRDLVDMDAHTVVGAGGHQRGADAADREVVAGEVALGVGHVRRGEAHVAEGGDLLRFQRGRVEGGDRDRHVLRRFRALLRGDDDFLQLRQGAVWQHARRRRQRAYDGSQDAACRFPLSFCVVMRIGIGCRPYCLPARAG
jgi:hypothetical protein